MTIEQAEEITIRYRKVLAELDQRGARQDPALLPESKETIMQAIQLVMAQLHFIDSATPKLINPLINAAMFIDSFTRMTLDSSDFIQSMQARKRELEQFMQDLKGIGRSHQFYWQQVYERVGAPLETRATSFFEGMKLKLGFGTRLTPAASVRSTEDDDLDRYVLD